MSEDADFWEALRSVGVEVECPSHYAHEDERTQPHWFLARLRFPDGRVFVLDWDEITAVEVKSDVVGGIGEAGR